MFDILVVFLGPQDLATVIRSHANAFQWMGHFALDCLRADLLDVDFHEVPHFDLPRKVQAILLQGIVDVLGQVRVLVQVRDREEHVLVAGTAGRDHV